jgi:hypothetical protein
MSRESHIKLDPIFDENNHGFCAILTEKGPQSSYCIEIDGSLPL